MRVIGVAVLVICVATNPVCAQKSMSEVTQEHDDEVRARNAERDFFYVSSVHSGLKTIRFYLDRDTIADVDASGRARAWVDVYEAIDAKRPIRLRHTKFLEEVRCGNEPQMRIKTMVNYSQDGTTQVLSGSQPFSDVIPGSSQETVHRFICHPEPANAYYPVFNGNTPEKDATEYFASLPR
ncbi:hypothetical protein C8J42_102542 [Sphingomonas sp. PP-CE-1A-559]|uniref:surface-adhesin E family protein n=1 Tax=Sphingomonas sp. PP-CE-1A-559 TaxID=2135657 RepID=UPI0010553FB5|nr:surface-adhesin E family protein [Sphingomonas sp. PP-CE-1A-559]TCP92766.1 hypothetical protein C8J42_102542 [Sphingomonas sp. PP-CE-1A-559]